MPHMKQEPQRISALIAALEATQAKYGDLEVVALCINPKLGYATCPSQQVHYFHPQEWGERGNRRKVFLLVAKGEMEQMP